VTPPSTIVTSGTRIAPTRPIEATVSDRQRSAVAVPAATIANATTSAGTASSRS
jgi:hypothetical protein